MRQLLSTLLFGLTLILFTAPLQASPVPVTWTGSFTSDHCTGGCGTPPFGEVVLTQDGSNVDFMVTLFDDNLFIRTGAGDFMDFKFNGSDVSLGDIDVSDTTGLAADQGDFDGDGGGYFNFGVYFPDQNTGGGSGLPGPIAFTVNDSAIADFLQPNDKDSIFVADIISDQTGNTGLVDVSGGGDQVPEPSTMILLGLGLVGVATIKKFKK